ncbi:glutamate--tRNA ligase family protein [Lunatibacter salilacus]|uniref:glutamate--tRNA ligase family protein n=1 Tax=Lunatibacter salilacus TaxID=2483804 RepID=UPI00131C4A95|nr:glutamate--tRNA ligase family protein [Lunatibacter salilacus]
MNNLPTFTKTRLAPTPSGYLHLGNILSFLITSALARRHQAKILLRIDDLDRSRVKDAFIDDIFETLHFLEIPWDEGPKDTADFKSNFSQVQRMDLYENALKELAEKNACFACVCSRKKIVESGKSKGYPGFCKRLHIPLSRKGCCWRYGTSREKSVPIIIYPDQLVNSDFPVGMKDYVVRKKDGYPAYQLSSVVDDVHFGIDLIVRGVDLWDSTLAQIDLASNLPDCQPFQSAVFFHHQLMKDGEHKMAKSSGSTSIQFLRKNGAKKADIYREISKFLNLPTLATSHDQFIELYNRDASQQ